jgi:hypothetical protein
MSWSLTETITLQMSSKPFDEQKHPTLWPSSATAIVDGEVVGKCRRQAFFRYAKDMYSFDTTGKYDYLKPIIELVDEHEEDVSDYMKWIWRAGELFEEFVIQMTKESGLYMGTQVSVYIPDFNVSGKIDLIALNPTTQKNHIVEVKSVYGFNASAVIGTDATHRKGQLGTPKEAHLMQLGIYQWWYGQPRGFDHGLLFYGARDTGKFAEYLVKVEKTSEDSEDYIFYKPHYPVSADWVNSNITIQSVLKNYKLILDSLESNEIPEPDFQLEYSQEKIEQLYQAGKLNKTETAQHEKRKQQIAEGKARVVKPVIKGDWQCRYCSYASYCYPNNGE